MLDDEAVSSRAAFAPGLMMVEARTEVYADSRMITLLGVIINNSIVYAVSQSGSAVRIALVSGREVTPAGATQIMEILGKEESLFRIRKAISLLGA